MLDNKNPKMINIENLVNNFTNLNEEESYYLSFHKKRYDYLINQVNLLATIRSTENQKNPLSILDIGPHFLTTLLRKSLGEQFTLNTLGWECSKTIVPDGIVNTHFTFDLNDTPFKEKWIECPQHDIIVMAEVFEHIYTAPEYFLNFLHSILKPGGYLLIGTPNAVSLIKRYSVLLGKNPYDRIRTTITNPGHFREYTLEELIDYGNQSGFSIHSYDLGDFYPQGNKSAFLKKYYPKLRDCIHIIYKK